MTQLTKKKDFIEIKYSGYSEGKVFDSNIQEDLKDLDSKAEPKKTIIVIGEGMVIPGLDKALEGKEIGKEYEINVSAEEGFGKRNRELVKTIPLKVFTEKKVRPYPGAVFWIDNTLARIITVSGARVMTDFNNPLAGKDLDYKFKIERIVLDEKERAEAVFKHLFKFKPKFEMGEKITIRGPKLLEMFIKNYQSKIKDLLDKEITFIEEKSESKPTQ